MLTIFVTSMPASADIILPGSKINCALNSPNSFFAASANSFISNSLSIGLKPPPRSIVFNSIPSDLTISQKFQSFLILTLGAKILGLVGKLNRTD